MKKFLLIFIFCLGCQPKSYTAKYTVVSIFDDVVLETNDKAKAYETAHNLTLMGRVLQSKPYYYVVENKK
jgi:hypothetical protein